MIVMKFGGTSNQDAAAMANVASIIGAHAGRKPVVVISAIAQATNLLAQAGTAAAEGASGKAEEVLAILARRHREIADSLVANRSRHDELLACFGKSFGELSTLLKGIEILRELTPRTLDAIVSYGEILSSRLVAAVLQERGLPAVWFDSSGFLITDDRYGAAMPYMDTVRERCRALLVPAVERGVIPVTQGYIGATTRGTRTTMGRESSDYSASILGAALDAEHVQIWTDVDGVLTADPRVVASVKKVKALSFREAFDLSYFGAKVLHPHTMIPAMEKNIPVSIFNSRKPSASGTLISGIAPDRRAMVKSVAYKNDMTAIMLSPRQAADQYLFWEQCLSQLARHGVRTLAMAGSGMSLVLAVPGGSDEENLANDLKPVAAVGIERGKSLISLIGQNLTADGSATERLFRTLGRYRLSAVSAGASPTSLSVLVDAGHSADAVRLLHEEFFRVLPDPALFEEPG
ncbi:MAG TPA: aspartate kinase [Bacteroidota bacterium]|nr:aspartate kinase [Bacteroidota bacterium]